MFNRVVRRGILVLTMALLALPAHRQPDPQAKIDLNGLWTTDRGVLVTVNHSGSNVSARFVGPKDCAEGSACPLATSPAYFFQGTLDGSRMSLTMMRCTHAQDMRDAGFADHWTTPATVPGVSMSSVSGTYRTQWYDYDNAAGKRINFRRNASGDRDRPFALTRTNCREELERLAAEVIRRRKVWKDMEAAGQDVTEEIADGQARWYKEVRDLVKEEVLDLIVPPGVKVVPGAFDSDAGDYITDWITFGADVAKASGTWALQKAGMIVLAYDLVIDMGNVLMKGAETIRRDIQMSGVMSEINDDRVTAMRDWISAYLEFEALRDLCAGEIPKDQQPKLEFGPADSEIGRAEAAASAGSAALGRVRNSAKAADAELARSTVSIEPLEELLRRHISVDPTKTLGQVLTASEIKQLQTGLATAARAFADALRSMRQLEQDARALSDILKRTPA